MDLSANFNYNFVEEAKRLGMSVERLRMMAQHSDVWMVLYDLGMRNTKLMYEVERRLKQWGYEAIQTRAGEITPDIVLGAAMKIRRFHIEERDEVEFDD